MTVNVPDKYWLAKYAFTKGIQEVSVDDIVDGYAWLAEYHEYYKIGRDIFADRDEAFRAAETMRLKKIASLEKQAEKLKGKRFV